MLVPIGKTEFLPLILWSFAAGVLIGLIYDVFRIRRYAFRETGKGTELFSKNLSLVDTVLCLIEDLLTALFTAVVMILLGFKFGHGVPRWYQAGAIIGGFCLYHVTVGRFVMMSVRSILHGIAAAAAFVGRYTVVPAKAFAGRTARKLRSAYEEKQRTIYTNKQEEAILSQIKDALGCDGQNN